MSCNWYMLAEFVLLCVCIGRLFVFLSFTFFYEAMETTLFLCSKTHSTNVESYHEDIFQIIRARHSKVANAII